MQNTVINLRPIHLEEDMSAAIILMKHNIRHIQPQNFCKDYYTTSAISTVEHTYQEISLLHILHHRERHRKLWR